MSDHYFEIGYFQLENLLLNQVQFYFFDISGYKFTERDEPLKSMLKNTTALEPSDIAPYLKEKGEEPSVPIVIMCEDGVISQRWAQKLGESGFLNVNVIEGGVQSLAEEAQSLTHG